MIHWAARTDVGKKREHNEDNLLTLPDDGLFLVADGVGGRSSGEVASAMCVETFQSASPVLGSRLASYAQAKSIDARNAVLSELDAICQIATRRIYETAETQGRKGMTTTLVAVAVGGGSAFLVHVGDSRAYLLRDGEVRQLTEDHSMVNELVRSGKMTWAEARASRHRHVITRAVGLYPTVQPSLGSFDLLPGDRILLCSDGLSDVVSPEKLVQLNADANPEGAVDALIEAALDRGGPDNVTVVVVEPLGSARTDEAVVRARTLEHLFLFEDMPYGARLQVARIMEEHWFAPGDTLVREGDPGDSMYVVTEGEVAVRAGGVELARLHQNEHFGELTLVDRLPRSASVEALSFGSAVSISTDALRDFCLTEPELGNALLWKLLRVLGYRLRAANARLVGEDAAVTPLEEGDPTAEIDRAQARMAAIGPAPADSTASDDELDDGPGGRPDRKH
jgi:serine/threonine protein phosphatase PrpC/CRP-like cAMP-binding protein